MSRIKRSIDEKVEYVLDRFGAVLLKGLPGVGKTSLLEYIAREKGWEVVYYQCHPQTSEEELLFRILPSEDTKSGVVVQDGVLVKAFEKASKGPVLLILDEWDKTRPSSDAFLLDVIQSRRISVPGFEVVLENPLNLKIALTSNDQRDFSEALLRRFPVVEIPPFRPREVYLYLKEKHPNNPYVKSVVRLYELSLVAGLSKPATLQELDQLLTAIEELENPDWDELVRIFVIKTEEDHRLLKEAERRWRGETVPVDDGEEEERLDPEAYETDRAYEEEEEPGREARLPRPSFEEDVQEIDLSSVRAVVRRDDETLTDLYRELGVSTAHELVLVGNDLLALKGDELVIRGREDARTVMDVLEPLLGREGEAEVVFEVEGRTAQDLLSEFLKEFEGAKISARLKGGYKLRTAEGEHFLQDGKVFSILYLSSFKERKDLERFLRKALTAFYPPPSEEKKKKKGTKRASLQPSTSFPDGGEFYDELMASLKERADRLIPDLEISTEDTLDKIARELKTWLEEVKEKVGEVNTWMNFSNGTGFFGEGRKEIEENAVKLLALKKAFLEIYVKVPPSVNRLYPVYFVRNKEAVIETFSDKAYLKITPTLLHGVLSLRVFELTCIYNKTYEPTEEWDEEASRKIREYVRMGKPFLAHMLLAERIIPRDVFFRLQRKGRPSGLAILFLKENDLQDAVSLLSNLLPPSADVDFLIHTVKKGTEVLRKALSDVVEAFQIESLYEWDDSTYPPGISLSFGADIKGGSFSLTSVYVDDKKPPAYVFGNGTDTREKLTTDPKEILSLREETQEKLIQGMENLKRIFSSSVNVSPGR